MIRQFYLVDEVGQIIIEDYIKEPKAKVIINKK